MTATRYTVKLPNREVVTLHKLAKLCGIHHSTLYARWIAGYRTYSDLTRPVIDNFKSYNNNKNIKIYGVEFDSWLHVSECFKIPIARIRYALKNNLNVIKVLADSQNGRGLTPEFLEFLELSQTPERMHLILDKALKGDTESLAELYIRLYKNLSILDGVQ